MSDETKGNISGDDILELVSRFSHNKGAVAAYCRMSKRIYELDQMKNEAEAALSSMPDKRNELEATLGGIAELRHTIIKIFCEYHGDKFNTSEQEGFDYTLDGVTDDVITTFKDYYKQFCHYRYEFYIRSEKPDRERKKEYKTEAETLGGFYDAATNVHKTFPLMTFTFKLNALKPYDVSVKELERFSSGVLAYMQSSYATMTHFNSDYHVDVLRDDTGRMLDRKNPSNIFDRWQRYLMAYDLKRKGGKTFAAIAKETKTIRKKSRVFDTEVTAGSSGRKDVIDAIKLIESAAKGTFPY